MSALKTIAAVLAAGSVTMGCASQVVDAQTNAVSTLPATSPVWQTLRYRFERLPMETYAQSGDHIEAIAAPILERAGWVRDDVNPRLAVLLTVAASPYGFTDWQKPYGHPYSWQPGLHGRFTQTLGAGRGVRGPWIANTPAVQPAENIYLREVGVMVRDLASKNIVYEARARHDSPWHDTDGVSAALMQAALQGFPKPPSGVRVVSVPMR